MTARKKDRERGFSERSSGDPEALGLAPPKPEDSVEWEIQHHLAEAADQLVAQGWTEEDALREARRRFGDSAEYGASMRRMEERRRRMERRSRGWELLRSGMGSSFRTARRYPGFTLGVILTLALGVGANATMYGIVDRLLLQPPQHVVDHQDVQRIYVQRPHFVTGEMNTSATFTYPDYQDLREHRGLESVAAYDGPSEMTVGSGQDATRARVALATASFFPLLGVSPALGRFFTAEEAAQGGQLTAVLGYEYWEQAYGTDPSAIGHAVQIQGRPFVIIGVAPPGFTGVDLERVDFWLPLEAAHLADWGDDSCLHNRGCWWMYAVARLAPGETRERAEVEATRLHLNGRRERIEEGRYSDRASLVFGPVIAARGPEASEESRVARWLAGVSILVLLIACANVANLLMARGTRRRRETAVRLALGAGRWRVVIQMMLESVALAAVGGAVALILARWGGAVVRSTLLPSVYFPNDGTSGRLLIYTALLAVLAGAAAGVAPAIQGSRVDLRDDLGDGARGATAGRSRLRSILSLAQAAFSVVLLVGAGLFIKSLEALRSQDLGIDVPHLAMATLEFGNPELTDGEKNVLYEEAMVRVRSVAGVRSAAATAVPFMWGYADEVRVPGRDSIPTLEGGGPYYYPVSPDYFETLGLAMLQGRPLTSADGPNDQKVVVVSETMARNLWPQEDPLGQCLLVGADETDCTTVVGVVEDAARNGYHDAPFMSYYLPAPQVENTYNAIYVRTGADAGATLTNVSSLLQSFSAQVRYAQVRTMDQILDPQARAWKLGATMFSAFGLLALCLAAIGLYSVLAFDVAQRTRELGIRTALGARKPRLLKSVVLQGARLAAAGVLMGLAVAWMGAPYLEDLLFQVSPRDPEVLGGVTVLLLAVTGLASLVPALRATRVDPMEAMRAE